MSTQLDELLNERRKSIAMACDRTAALNVLLPRILGGLVEVGIVNHGSILKRRVAYSRGLTISMCPEYWGVSIVVRGGVSQSAMVMSMVISFVGDAEFLGGRVHQKTWVRTPSEGTWQCRLFDLFKIDSSALLRAPVSDLPGLAAELLELPIWWNPSSQPLKLSAPPTDRQLSEWRRLWSTNDVNSGGG